MSEPLEPLPVVPAEYMPFLCGERSKERRFVPIEPMIVPFAKSDRVQLAVIVAGVIWCAGYLAGFVR